MSAASVCSDLNNLETCRYHPQRWNAAQKGLM